MNTRLTEKSNQAFTEFKTNWQTRPLFSTGMALIVMVILQTIALGFNFDGL